MQLMKSILLVCLLALAATSARAFETLQVQVQDQEINVYLYEPPGNGPFPLLVLSHGSPRSPEDRLNFGAQTLHAQAEAYVAAGVAVAVPVRRGYGGSGRYVEGFGDRPNYYLAGMATADDIDAAIAALSTRQEIDAKRVVLMGVSAGGWGSVAAATRGGVMGVVNFAGGRGSTGLDHVNAEPALISAAAQYGGASHVPELWIYSANDQFFYPALAQALFQAFANAGGQATFITAPAFGDDGHRYISDIPDWRPEVDGFLRKIGFLR